MSASEFNQPGVPNTDFLNPSAINFTQYPDAANDLCLNTLHSILANQEKYYNGTTIKTRLFTIMRNIFIEHRRSPKQKIISVNTPIDYLIIQKKGISE